MTDVVEVRIAFPDLDGPAAGEQALGLLHELRRDADLLPHLDRDRTKVARDDPAALDFGVTLIAVLGTPAIILLAKAVRDWAERTGTVVEANGTRIKNVRSQDLAAIVRALQADNDKGASKKRGSGGAGRKAAAKDAASVSSAKAKDESGITPAKPGGKARQAKPRK